MKSAIASTFFRQIFTGILQLAVAVLIARFFGAESNGFYNIALLLPIMISTIMNLGITSSNVYFLAAKKIDCATAISLSISIGLWIIAIGLCAGVIVIFYRDIFFPNINVLFLMTSLLVFPFSLLQSFIAAIFLGLERFKIFNILSLIQPITLLLFILSIVLFDLKQVELLLLSYLTSCIISFILHFYYLMKVKKVSDVNKNNKNNKNIKNKMMTYGLKSHLSNILSFINYRADLFLVNYYMNPISAGIYIISIQLTEKLWLISQAVSTVTLPRLTSFSNADEYKTIMTLTICRFVFISTALCSFILALMSFHFIAFVFGEEYQDSWLPILILLPGVVFGAVSRVIANDIASRGRPELNIYGSVVTVVVNVCGNILLIPIYGLAGAALATSIAYMINLFTRYINLKMVTSFSTRDLFLINKLDLLLVKKLFLKNA